MTRYEELLAKTKELLKGKYQGEIMLPKDEAKLEAIYNKLKASNENKN